ncbi:dTDP-4-dehydrorhamnose 3,5-epimerase [Novosphingobium guangzhouense]|uniref:dTDP-4-dehydrorhamnose 3,5-epimerase n=1 Tax=Novosphingobium guangzhouense TaxID=1850347 RepID=A0A2K2G146_9SPHN|nr:dTDP-4-dehydrorhamnose 3,5-epimerase [Novosphingobium guangzhouense]PNU04763.1 dTDP-4-dehydrorhamnose 3,5-epimerase [Novosphingobium guangzhouense]
MKFHRTTLADARLIELDQRGDERGVFARTMCAAEFAAEGLVTTFVQQNMSTSAERGTVRGMHFQLPPHREVKLVRCVRGAILDVIVDIRPGSPSFLQHEGFELSAQNRRQLYVPEGFAHAFQTLTDDVEVSYLVSAAYAPEAERGLRWNDPALAIDWPFPVSVISDKDANWPLLDDPRTDPRITCHEMAV